MTYKQALKMAVDELIEMWKVTAVERNEGTGFAFMTPCGPCLFGIIGAEKDAYLDMRCRVFLGEITADFDFRELLLSNESIADLSYGILSLDERDFLVMTHNFRFPLCWKPEELKDVLDGVFMRHFMLPERSPGLEGIKGGDFAEMFKKYEFNWLFNPDTRNNADESEESQDEN